MDTLPKRSAFAQAYLAALRAEREARAQQRYLALPPFWQTIEAIKAERQRQQLD